jgi:hypothetical protein
MRKLRRVIGRWMDDTERNFQDSISGFVWMFRMMQERRFKLRWISEVRAEVRKQSAKNGFWHQNNNFEQTRSVGKRAGARHVGLYSAMVSHDLYTVKR